VAETFQVVLEGTSVARLSGELDLAAYPSASEELAPLFGSPGEVILDLADVAFLDSSGIRLLIRLQKSLVGDGRLVLRSPKPHVARVLEIAGLPDLGIRIEGAATEVLSDEGTSNQAEDTSREGTG
jgi:anti-sigma B factor antagonist